MENYLKILSMVKCRTNQLNNTNGYPLMNFRFTVEPFEYRFENALYIFRKFTWIELFRTVKSSLYKYV